MQSRMDKYNSTTKSTYKSRTQKNKDLYEGVKGSDLTNFNVNSNVSVIDTNAKNIDVNKLSQILDERYNEYTPKRRSIEVPAYEEPIIEKPLVDTKEYDINLILEKAKQGKNVDYNKERLKKVREAQYEILNNLDLEIQKVEETKKNSQKQEEEANLMNLINTITQIEIKNKEIDRKKEISASLDVLTDLSDSQHEVDENDIILPQKEEKEKTIISSTKETKEEIILENDKEDSDVKTDEENTNPDNRDEHVQETLSKLNIDISSYDDFADISKNDKGALIIKIVIFIIIIALVIGAVYILNGILQLGLF